MAYLMRGARSAEQLVLEAFRGRTYVTIAEVIVFVEELMACRGGAWRGVLLHGRGAHGPSLRGRRNDR